MKLFASLAAVTLLGLAQLAAAQVKMPSPNDPGGSPETAIRLVSPNEIMIDRMITRWLRAHYPGWDAEPHQMMNIGPERYAVVYITSANNPGRRVYFRILSSQSDPDNDPFPAF